MQGDADVYQNVEVTVNGQTTSVERNEPGSIDITIVNGQETVIINGQPVTPTIHPTLPDTPATTISTNTIGNTHTSVARYIKDLAISIYSICKKTLDKFF